jgi:hypothetical protein
MAIDPIHEAIRAKRREAEQRRREADLLDAEVRGMELVLNLMGGTRDAPPPKREQAGTAQASSETQAEVVGRSVGRQRGAISKRWRIALLDLQRRHGSFTLDDVVATIQRLEGRTMRPSEVRRQFEGYFDHGYVRQVGPDQYEVPEEAAARFRASVELENEPDEAQANEAEGASRSESPSASVTTTAGYGSVPVQGHGPALGGGTMS